VFRKLQHKQENSRQKHLDKLKHLFQSKKRGKLLETLHNSYHIVQPHVFQKLQHKQENSRQKHLDKLSIYFIQKRGENYWKLCTTLTTLFNRMEKVTVENCRRV